MPHRPIPLALVPQIARWLGVVGAGFPSPAQDYEESRIDLIDWLAPGRASSFVMRVDGWSMKDVGIHDGDLIIVDRGIDATPGATVVAAYQDGFVVRTLRQRQGRPVLVGANAEMRTAVTHSGDHRIRRGSALFPVGARQARGLCSKARIPTTGGRAGIGMRRPS